MGSIHLKQLPADARDLVDRVEPDRATCRPRPWLWLAT